MPAAFLMASESEKLAFGCHCFDFRENVSQFKIFIIFENSKLVQT